VDTPDVSLFGTKASSLIFESYDGGRDSKERLTQVFIAFQGKTA